jgi:hypothetical protein
MLLGIRRVFRQTDGKSSKIADATTMLQTLHTYSDRQEIL